MRSLTSLVAVKQAISSPKGVLVDFYAPSCAPCRALDAKWPSLEAAFPSVTFVKVDVMAVPDAARAFQVAQMPTLLFFKGGRLVSRMAGADLAKIQAALKQIQN